MENFIIIVILLLIIGMAALYISREKKKGTRCIGCPASGCCSGKGCSNACQDCKCNTDSN